jgi:hypothetical protein
MKVYKLQQIITIFIEFGLFWKANYHHGYKFTVYPRFFHSWPTWWNFQEPCVATFFYTRSHATPKFLTRMETCIPTLERSWVDTYVLSFTYQVSHFDVIVWLDIDPNIDCGLLTIGIWIRSIVALMSVLDGWKVIYPLHLCASQSSER